MLLLTLAGFVGRLPHSAWTGHHTLAVYAVNPAPNAKAQNKTQLLLRSQEVCNGVTCAHEDSTEEAVLGGDGASAWSQIQMMRAVL